MAPVYLTFTVLFSYIFYANGQTSCTTPGGGSGACISLFDCPLLMKILQKKDKTEQEVETLKNSQCGSKDQTPMVCCSNQCLTPDGLPGACVSIYNCRHLANMLRPPVSEDNIRYVTNSKCTSKERYSVCCATNEQVLVAAPGVCAATVSAFPPDSRSECCGVDSTVGNKIVGGNATTVEQYPWLVLIEYLQLGKIKTACGGALISGRYVLTAAHCVIGAVVKSVGKPVSVRLGEYDKANSGPDCVPVEAGAVDCTDGIIQIPIERIIEHPDYSVSVSHSHSDIALIRLKEMAPFTDFIRPICLPKVDVTTTAPANFTMFAAGWGATDTRVSSNVKMHVDLPYAKLDHCESGYVTRGQNVKLTPKQICAGGVPGKDSCRGDSGGPLMYENIKTFEVIGVVSFGPSPCGLPDVPGVYTKVYEFLPWIRQNIEA